MMFGSCALSSSGGMKELDVADQLIELGREVEEFR